MKKEKLLYIIFLLYPVIDLLTALQARYINFPITLGIVIRGLFIATLFFYVLKYAKEKMRLISLTYFLLVVIYMGAYFLTKIDIKPSSIITELTFLYKVFSLPLLLLFLITYFREFKVDKRKLTNVLTINGVVFIILLLIPLITNTAYNTYPEKYNLLGKMGYFYAANEISAILVILFPYIYKTINNSRFMAILIIISAFVILSVGTKVVLVGVGIVTIYNMVLSLIRRKNRIINVIILFFVGGLMYFSPAYQNIVTRKERIDDNIAYADKNQLIAYNTTTDDTSYQDIIASGRNEYIVSNQSVFSKDNTFFFFGMGLTNRLRLTNNPVMVEIDLIDIFYRLGVVGLLVYLIPFIFLVYIISINIWKRLNRAVFRALLSLLLAIGISLIAGHVLIAPAVNIYIVITIILLLVELDVIKAKEKPKKVMFISTTGGHLSELFYLLPLINKYDSSIVTEKTKTTLPLKSNYDHVYYLLFGSDRHNIISYGLRLIANCFISLYIYIRVKPNFIVSTGAHFAGPMLCIGKLLGSKIIFIETFANVSNKSITGRIVYLFSDYFIVQWNSMKKLYKKAIKAGGIK